VQVQGRPFRVAKTLPELGSEVDSTIVMHLSDAQEILKKPDKVNEILALDCRCAEADLPKIRARKDLRIGRYEMPTVHYLALNYRTRLLANRLVRKAITLAVNREGLLEKLILIAEERYERRSRLSVER